MRRIGRAAALGALVLFLAPLCASLSLRLADRQYPFPRETLSRESAVVVSDRAGRPLRLFLPADERWRLPVSLADLPPDLPEALIASEDRFFRHHPGINPLSILRAAWNNLRAGRVVSGAATTRATGSPA